MSEMSPNLESIILKQGNWGGLLIAAYGGNLTGNGSSSQLYMTHPNADIDNDGYVGPHDLAILNAHYGQHYP